MIRSSDHTTNFSNRAKRAGLGDFLDEYRLAAQLVLNYLWDNKITCTAASGSRVLDIKNQQYDCPTFISTVGLPFTTKLSARALKCCATQVCGIIKAVTEKPRRRAFKLQQLKLQNKPTTNLEKKIATQKLTKPIITNLYAELNSICCDFKVASGPGFDAFLQLTSIGKSFGKIRIPIKHHRQSRRWQRQGTMLKSFLISKDSITIRWGIKNKPTKQAGAVVGADQGLKNVLTLSTAQQTPKQDRHGHSLEAITKKLSRKTKGSKAFGRAQEHRKNFINYSINQLNFSNIKQVNLEEVINITYKKHTSRLLSHWTNTLIRNKLQSKCEELGVQVSLQSSTYRSQRCFQCGWVCKTNRKGVVFKCKSCGRPASADLNAAKNHTLNLPDAKVLRSLKLNLKGFFWKPEGFFDLNGKALTVPFSKNQS